MTTDEGERLTAKFLITAVGCLSTANLPNIPGLENSRDAGSTPDNGHMKESTLPASVSA